MTTEIVINTVAKATGVTIDQLRSPSRVEHICNARHIAAYALHVMLGNSLNVAGYIINRNHATVLQSCRVCEEWLKEPRVNPIGAHLLKQVISTLTEGEGDKFNPKQK